MQLAFLNEMLQSHVLVIIINIITHGCRMKMLFLKVMTPLESLCVCVDMKHAGTLEVFST